MMFGDFGAGNAFYIGELVKEDEPNDIERLLVDNRGPDKIKLPAGRFIKKAVGSDFTEYATPLTADSTISDLYGIVTDDITEDTVHAATDPVKSYLSEKGESARIARLSAKLSIVPYTVLKDGLTYTQKMYMYVIISGSDVGGIYVSNSASEQGYIPLNERFVIRVDSITKNAYLEYNPATPVSSDPYRLPAATTSSLGGIIVGSGLTIDASGHLAVASA